MNLGIDVGNGFIKLKGGVLIPSRIKEGATTKGFKSKCVHDVEYNGINYIVGDGASLTGKARYFQADYKLLLLTAIALSSSKRTNIKANVVIGVPVDYYYTLKDAIEEELNKIDKEDIMVDGKAYHIELERITVFIEGAYPILVNDDRHIVTIDIGTGTINIIEWKEQAILNKFTSREGFQTLYSEIATHLNTNLGTEYKPDDIQSLIGKNTGYNAEGEVDVSCIMDFIKRYVWEIISQVETRFNFAGCERLVVFGGGAESTYPFIEEKYHKAEQLENSQFINQQVYEVVAENIEE